MSAIVERLLIASILTSIVGISLGLYSRLNVPVNYLDSKVMAICYNNMNILLVIAIMLFVIYAILLRTRQ